MPEHEAAPHPATRKRSWWQFSLGTMLVGTVIVALIAWNVSTLFQLQQAHETIAQHTFETAAYQLEIDNLRGELRHLDLSDKTKLHIYTMPSYDDMVWRFRIFTPDNMTVKVHCAAGDINKAGGEFPEEKFTHTLMPGEIVLTCKVYRNDDGEWEIAAQQDVDRIRKYGAKRVPDGKLLWHLSLSGDSTAMGVSTRRQSTFDGSQPIELVRHKRRAFDKIVGGRLTDKDAGGVIFWLEPVVHEPKDKAE